MEELIQKILKCIELREQAKLHLSLQEPFTRTDKEFLRYKTIELEGAGVLFLSKLAQLDGSDERVAWLINGLDYGCEYKIHLSFDAIGLVPLELFRLPVALFTKQGKQLIYFPNKVISYGQVASLHHHEILIVNHGQILTALAHDVLEKNAVGQIERF
jgi:microcompartment protein PduM